MSKGLGIAALIVAILSIFIPLAGILIGWVALIFALFGALFGDRMFAVAVVAISSVNYMFFSPSLWLATAGANVSPGETAPNWLLVTTLAFIVAPIVGIILNSTGKVALGK